MLRGWQIGLGADANVQPHNFLILQFYPGQKIFLFVQHGFLDLQFLLRLHVWSLFFLLSNMEETRCFSLDQ